MTVTEKGTNLIDVYRIHSDGSLTSVVDPAQIVLPFCAIGLVAE